MAYLTLLDSVPENEVLSFRVRAVNKLPPGLLMRCSHILTSWVRRPELRQLLETAIDGGAVLRSDLWHPIHPPLWHDPDSTKSIHQELLSELRSLVGKHGQPDASDWYAVEISKAIKAIGHAAMHKNGIVSALCPPFDSERARRVHIPIEGELGCQTVTPAVSELFRPLAWR